MYLSFGMPVSFLALSKLFYKGFWSAVLLPVKSPVASAVFWIALLDAVFFASVVEFLGLLRIFWLYLLLMFFANGKIRSLLHIESLVVELNSAFLQ